MNMATTNVEQLETDVLLDAIYRRWGYDFRHYARSSLNRRLKHRLQMSKMQHLSDMLPRIIHDEEFFELLLRDLSVTVTEMFRDSGFYVSLRKDVIPVLKTYLFIKIWHAGCATGEEVYSMAVLLKEEGLLHRAQIYATDYNNRSLEIAREGVYPLDHIRKFTANYNAAGGTACFSDYYTAKYNAAKLCESLKQNVTFANHNLVTDRAFGEMHLIVCRNVLIYFDNVLQDHVVTLFKNSLNHH
jgi:chemotaxis protein methyltransferase CheR